MQSISKEDAYISWLRSLGFRMDRAVLFTGTYDTRPLPTRTVKTDWNKVTREACYGHLKYLIHELNKDILGNHYKRLVKHSYFGYLGAVEYHISGDPHCHLVIDDLFTYERAHKIWREKFGLVTQIDQMRGEQAVRYALKYVIKSGEFDPIVWVPRKRVKLAITKGTDMLSPMVYYVPPGRSIAVPDS